MSDKPKPNCHACTFSGMEPQDMNLTCFHKDANPPWGLHIWKEPLSHCPNFSKFEQHPGRNPDGTLKLSPMTKREFEKTLEENGKRFSQKGKE